MHLIMKPIIFFHLEVIYMHRFVEAQRNLTESKISNGTQLNKTYMVIALYVS